jgi:hypothetical protein
MQTGCPDSGPLIPSLKGPFPGPLEAFSAVQIKDTVRGICTAFDKILNDSISSIPHL